MGRITEQVQAGKILISDGAWGTFLQQKGLKPGECPELWNVTRSDDVLAIAESYISAGADMIETNSFGGSSFKLKKFGLADKVFELNEAAAKISRQAAGDKIVLGSVGPTGKILMMGEITEEELYQAFKEQCMALESGGSDAIMIETMTDIDEARIAINAAKQNTSCEVFCTMTFDKTLDGNFMSMMGVSPTEMANTLVKLGVDLIGANCGNGISDMIGVVKEIRLINADIPILIHANAGMPILKNGKAVFPETPKEMASRVLDLTNAGANIIGGCCGTTPEHIKEVKNIVASI